MKRILIFTSIALAVPLFAQTTTKQSNTKPDVNKSGQVSNLGNGSKNMLTRNELRACLLRNAEHKHESEAIETERASFQSERNGILSSKSAMLAQMNVLEQDAIAIKSDQTALLALRTQLEQPVEKSEIAAAEERRKAFNLRAEQNEKRVVEYNMAKRSLVNQKEALDLRIAANNATDASLRQRSDQLQRVLDDWKIECGDRPFLAADEAAVKKGL